MNVGISLRLMTNGVSINGMFHYDIVKVKTVTLSLYAQLKQLLFCISTVTTTSN